MSHTVEEYCGSRGYGIVREYCGHGIGREMHEDPEVPNYGKPGHGLRLMPGREQKQHGRCFLSWYR